MGYEKQSVTHQKWKKLVFLHQSIFICFQQHSLTLLYSTHQNMSVYPPKTLRIVCLNPFCSQNSLSITSKTTSSHSLDGTMQQHIFMPLNCTHSPQVLFLSWSTIPYLVIEPLILSHIINKVFHHSSHQTHSVDSKIKEHGKVRRPWHLCFFGW